MNTLAATSKTNEKPAMIVSAVFLLISMICLIVNYSVNHSISWSLFPIGALIVVWAMIVPMILMDSNKSLGVFVGLSATLIPYLFLIQTQTSSKGWVTPLALPIAVLSLLALGISLVSFRLIKSNKFYPIALTIFLFGVVVNYGVGIIVTRFTEGNNIADLSRITTMSISAILSMIFVVGGVIRGNKASEQI